MQSSTFGQHGERRHLGGAALTMAPTVLLFVVLVGVLAWVASGQLGVDARSGTTVFEEARGVRNVPGQPFAHLGATVELRLFIIAVEQDNATAVQMLLESESSLRSLLGEQLRITDGLIVAQDESEAERIADAIRADLGTAGSPSRVVILR